MVIVYCHVSFISFFWGGGNGKHYTWSSQSFKWFRLHKPLLKAIFSHHSCKWCYQWVTGVITLVVGVITSFITGSGSTLYLIRFIWHGYALGCAPSPEIPVTRMTAYISRFRNPLPLPLLLREVCRFILKILLWTHVQFKKATPLRLPQKRQPQIRAEWTGEMNHHSPLRRPYQALVAKSIALGVDFWDSRGERGLHHSFSTLWRGTI